MIETAHPTTLFAAEPTAERLAHVLLWQWLVERRWTLSDHIAIFGDYNGLVEVVDGRLVIHDMPGTKHQQIVVKLVSLLGASAAGRVLLAPLPVHLADNTVREPDVLFFATAHLDRLHDAYVDPPDLAIEVRSPDSHKRDLVEKRAEYALAGIPEYWILDPAAQDVLVLRLDDAAGAYTEAGRFAGADVVTALSAPDVPIRVADMFA